MTIDSERFGLGPGRLIERGRFRELFELPVEELKEHFKLNGMFLFRGFNVDPWTMKRFAEQFSKGFNRDRLRPPLEGSDGYVQMVTEGMGYVEPHSEQANSPFRPDAIWFCCERPAAEGGETLVWDGVSIWERLRPELKQLFKSKRIRFFQCYSEDKWKLFLGVGATLADARELLDRADGVTYHVTADDAIYIEYVCPAVVATRYGALEAFANSLLSERKNTLGQLMSFDDGTPISDDIIAEVEGVMDQLKQEITWQPGDLAFIDNSRFVHGRNAYSDKRRKIFSSLSFLNF